jgi:hypothetical protein
MATETFYERPLAGEPRETSVPNLWSLAGLSRPADPNLAAVLDLADEEFRASHFEAAAEVVRIAASHAPDDAALQRSDAKIRSWLHETSRNPPTPLENIHLARAKAYRLLGDVAAAQAEIQSALACRVDFPAAQFLLAEIKLPGEGYYRWLKWLHERLLPKTYLEIGVLNGDSLCLAQPPTRAIGIDPAPRVIRPLATETHLYCLKSNAFFASGSLGPLLDVQPIELAFIDGSHLLEDVVKDFINLEVYCRTHSVIALHDTIPLDDITQRRQRTTAFYTGDVWKAVLCFKHYRPDLAIFTIATPPTGLTVISNLDPKSRLIADHYDEAISKFIGIRYSDLEESLHAALNVVANDFNAVESRLRAAGIPI